MRSARITVPARRNSTLPSAIVSRSGRDRTRSARTTVERSRAASPVGGGASCGLGCSTSGALAADAAAVHGARDGAEAAAAACGGRRLVFAPTPPRCRARQRPQAATAWRLVARWRGDGAAARGCCSDGCKRCGPRATGRCRRRARAPSYNARDYPSCLIGLGRCLRSPRPPASPGPTRAARGLRSLAGAPGADLSARRREPGAGIGRRQLPPLPARGRADAAATS